MYIKVRLLNRYKNPLLYKIPEKWDQNRLQGRIVLVPLKNRLVKGYIDSFQEKLNNDQNFTIKEAGDLQNSPEDVNYHKFVQKISNYYSIDKIEILERLGRVFDFKQSEDQQNEEVIPEEVDLGLTLTLDQKNIVEKITAQIDQNRSYIGLIHGVTGSGKTEIYKNLIYSTLKLGKSILFLLPEISLAIEFYQRLKKELPEDFNIYSYHSATSAKSKKQLWQAIINKHSVLIIGVHLPVFLPLSNLGLILIDEEHDVGFQEKKHPKFNTKEIALIRAQIYKIPIVLGSGTPSISSLYSVQNKGWELFKLKDRFKGVFPAIQLVNLKHKERGHFWISKELEKAIESCLEKKEKCIIFLNRRGYCFFIQCKLCGHIPHCINCSISLTLHSDRTLRCHYCNFKIPEPTSCLKCEAKEQEILKKGIGTQQITKILAKLFPKAKIDRLDLDTTIDKKKLQKTLQDFDNHKFDILVGTQTITKGYNFNGVTLIGILWADSNLSFPIYNASEVALQQIIQVAGRAGRQGQKSLVIVQTIKNHEIFDYVNELKYESFYEYEIKNRIEVKYPPFIRLAEIEVKNRDEAALEKEIKLIKQELDDIIKKLGGKVISMGPVDAMVQKIKNFCIKKFYLKAENSAYLNLVYNEINRSKYSSSIYFTPNPLS